MSLKTSAGLQTSGTTAESSEEKESASTEDAVEADLDLAELIDFHESLEWASVPGISTAEAAAWTTRLIEARERVQEGL